MTRRRMNSLKCRLQASKGQRDDAGRFERREVVTQYSRWVLGFITLALCARASCVAQPASSKRIDRLVHLGQLWGAIRYLHPFLAYRDIDWDAALVRAIPDVRAAETSEQYAKALQTMLDTLADPMTCVLQVKAKLPRVAGSSPSVPSVSSLWIEDGILKVDLRAVPASPSSAGLREELARVTSEISKARAIILDLRGPANSIYDGILSSLDGLLVSHPIQVPAQRYIMHSGYRPQVFPSSGGYFSAFVTLPEEVFVPANGSSRKRIIFLASSDTVLPPIALALQAAGEGVIVTEGPLRREDVHRLLVDLGENVQAMVRITEYVPLKTWHGVHADIELPPLKGKLAADIALRKARDFAAGRVLLPKGSIAPSYTALAEAVWHPDDRYPSMLNPSGEYRLLAVFRFWSILHYFYPYGDLIVGWEQRLPEFVARMEAAENSRDYALLLAEMAAAVKDGHLDLWGHPELSQLYGEAFVPVELRWIEGRCVVTQVREEPAVRASGIQVGDEVTAANGLPFARIPGLF